MPELDADLRTVPGKIRLALAQGKLPGKLGGLDKLLENLEAISDIARDLYIHSVGVVKKRKEWEAEKVAWNKDKKEFQARKKEWDMKKEDWEVYRERIGKEEVELESRNPGKKFPVHLYFVDYTIKVAKLVNEGHVKESRRLIDAIINNIKKSKGSGPELSFFVALESKIIKLDRAFKTITRYGMKSNLDERFQAITKVFYDAAVSATNYLFEYVGGAEEELGRAA